MIEGFDVPDLIPKMATMSDDLVHECITVYKAIGGLGYGEVVSGRGRMAGEEAAEFRRSYTQKRNCSQLSIHVLMSSHDATGRRRMEPTSSKDMSPSRCGTTPTRWGHIREGTA